MITYQGAKMSKSKGNVISPSTYVERYGADTARCYILFLGPPDQDADWSDDGVGGVHRFLGRVWRLGVEVAERSAPASRRMRSSLGGSRATRSSSRARRTGRSTKVTDDIERFHFNTAIVGADGAGQRDLPARRTACYGDEAGRAGARRSRPRPSRRCCSSSRRTSAPRCTSASPASGCGRRRGRRPTQRLLERDTVALVVQVNGKVRDRIEVEADARRGRDQAPRARAPERAAPPRRQAGRARRSSCRASSSTSSCASGLRGLAAGRV